MRKSQKVAIAIAAIVAVAGVTSILVRHGGSSTVPGIHRAQVVTPQIPDAQIVKAIRDANIQIGGLSATNVGGIVVLKGTADAAAALQAAAVVKQLGFQRVANLIVAQTASDDEGIRRKAERHLASTRGLDGCNLRVSCTKGVLRVEGTSSSDLQADLARNVLRGIGAQEVQIALKRM
jgi:osmotically-inducible protein OsmY